MTARRLLVLTALALVLAGCGSLRVKVDVLEPAVVEGEVDRLLFRQALPRVLSQSDVALRERFAAVENAHFNLVSKVADAYRAEAATRTGTARQGLIAIADGLIANFPRTRGPYYRDEEAAIRGINERIRALNESLRTAAPAAQPAIRAQLASTLRERQLRLEDIDRTVRANVGTLLERERSALPALADPRTPAGADVAQAEAAVADARKSLIGGQGLVQSPYAYAVAAAPEEKWSPRFNETFGGGYLGNLNVAIKMVDLGDFTLKGVTFDPSDVVRAISKVTVQTLVLAAQIYGVPIKAPAGAAPQAPAGGALAASSTRLATVQEASAAREAKLQDYRAALTTIALAIIREQPKLAGTDSAQRQAAIEAIKATYEAHKTRLDLRSLQGATK